MSVQSTSVKHVVLVWDWKARVDLDHLNYAIKHVYDGQNAPCIHQVDTGQDCFAIIVASCELTEQQAQALWDDRNDDE